MLLRLSLAALAVLPDSGATARREIDLLALVDLGKDRVRGEWAREEGALVATTSEAASRVQIPYLPPEEYDLTVVAERIEGSDALVIGLASGGAQTAYELDGYVSSGHISGFEVLDGRTANRNESTRPGPVFENGRAGTVVVSVRRGRIAVSVDGNPLLDWSGEFSRLGVRADYVVPEKRALFVGAYACRFRISRMALRGVSGAGKPLR
jgi:hypothetical protein